MNLRPGPDRLDPGLAPGGLVLHVYNKHGQRLIEQRVRPGDDIEFLAEAGATATLDRTGPGQLIAMVVYDGDDGHRWTVDEILERPA